MSSTPAVYPTNVVTFTTKVNHVDVVNDDDVNKLQNEVIAMQTYFGTNPQGSKSDLTTRLAQLMATNGAIAQGVAFPTNPVEGQLFWRVDLTTMYVYGLGSWNSQGQSLSNAAFSFCGSSNFTNKFMPAWISTSNGVYSTYVYSRFKKISGVSSIKIDAVMWKSNPASGSPIARYTINTLVATGTVSSTTPAITSTSIDVTSLVNGTTYDFVIEFQESGGSQGVFLNSVIGIAS